MPRARGGGNKNLLLRSVEVMETTVNETKYSTSDPLALDYEEIQNGSTCVSFAGPTDGRQNKLYRMIAFPVMGCMYISLAFQLRYHESPSKDTLFSHSTDGLITLFAIADVRIAESISELILYYFCYPATNKSISELCATHGHMARCPVPENRAIRLCRHTPYRNRIFRYSACPLSVWRAPMLLIALFAILL
jgi:hypothetical protein